MDSTTMYILIGIGCVAAYFLLSKGSGSSGSGGSGQAPEFRVKFSQLAIGPSTQVGVLTPASNVSMAYNSAFVLFNLTQISSGGDSIGVSYISADSSIKVYLTYYEFLNFVNSGPDAILTVPKRTLVNGIITNDTSAGYTITKDGLVSFEISDTPGPITRSLVDGATTIPLNSLLAV